MTKKKRKIILLFTIATIISIFGYERFLLYLQERSDIVVLSTYYTDGENVGKTSIRPLSKEDMHSILKRMEKNDIQVSVRLPKLFASNANERFLFKGLSIHDKQGFKLGVIPFDVESAVWDDHVLTFTSKSSLNIFNSPFKAVVLTTKGYYSRKQFIK